MCIVMYKCVNLREKSRSSSGTIGVHHLSHQSASTFNKKDPGSIKILLSNPRWEKRLLKFLELSGVGRVMSDGVGFILLWRATDRFLLSFPWCELHTYPQGMKALNEK
jgi:hypothetical protein